MEVAIAWKRALEEPPVKVEKDAPFSGFAQRWLDRKTDLKHGSRLYYIGIIKNHLFPHFGHQPVRSITIEQCVELRAITQSRGLSAKGVNNIMGALNTILGRAHAWGYAASNPMKEVKSLRVTTKEFAYWTAAESSTFLAWLQRHDPYYYPLYLLALRTGMRSGEIKALRWEDLDLVKGQVHVRRSTYKGVEGTPKSGKSRRIPFARDAVAALREMDSRAGGHVFRRKRCGRTHNVTSMRNVHLRLMRDSPVSTIRFHDLRHSFASQLVAAGTPLFTVQKLMGHSTPNMTMRYAHLAPDDAAPFTELLGTASNVVPLVKKSGENVTRSELREQLGS